MAVTLVYTKQGTPYIDQYKETAKQMASARDTYLKDQSALRDAYRTQMNTEQTQNIDKSNKEYDASGRQNYINYMQAQKALPNQLNALGIRGGASESSLIRLGNNYGSNVASNESARNTALAGIRQTYAQKLSDYDRDYKNTLADYEQDYQTRLANAYATAYQNQINWEKEQQQKDLEYFSGVIEGLYGDTTAYDNLISQLQASSDPNKEYKILLATKAKQTLIDKLAEAAASSGGGYSSGGGGGYYSSGGGYDDTDYGSGSGKTINLQGNYRIGNTGRVVTANNSKSSNSGTSSTKVVNRNASKQKKYSKYW